MKAWPEIAHDDRQVFWGLSYFIHDVMTEQVTNDDLMKAMEFMEQAKIDGKELKFDYKMWRRVINEYDGYLPIVIEGLPEGSVFYAHQPMVQVTSLGEGFGEIAAHVEPTLMGATSIATARATVAGHWYEHLAGRMMKYGYTEAEARDKARKYIHDFGMRASFCKDESMILGMAHLLFFYGTDTFNAAFAAFCNGAKENGKSLLALAHRTVQSYENEFDCYQNLWEQDWIGSHVADCNDYERAVEKGLVPLALKDPNKIVVARPDSGDAKENAMFVIKKAEENGLVVTDKFGFKCGKNLRYIEGNSVNPVTVDEQDDYILSQGYNPYDFGVYGCGGWLRNTCTRDSLSSKYALNAVGLENRPVMKFSKVAAKESIPGPIELINGLCSIRSRVYNASEIAGVLKNDCKQRLVTYYKGGVIADWVGDYKAVFERTQSCWPAAPKTMSREAIVAPMKDTIEQIRQKYKG